MKSVIFEYLIISKVEYAESGMYPGCFTVNCQPLPKLKGVTNEKETLLQNR